MFHTHKILFPVDFSRACLGASRYVEAFALRFHSEVMLLHVVDSTTYTAWGPTGIPALDLSAEGMRWARERIDSYRTVEFKPFTVHREVRDGDPGFCIVDAARKFNADLIMMPTHGMGAFKRFLLGSITAKVLHDAECPVWTAAHLETATPGHDRIEFQKVLCAVDLGSESRRALHWAASFAGETSSELIVTHIVPANETRPAKYFDEPLVHVLTVAAREELQALIDSCGIKARIVMGSGEPAKAVSEIAQFENVHQLVIARGALTHGLGRLRTHAYALIRSAPCPVVSI